MSTATRFMSVAFALCLLGASEVSAQNSHAREGFWINFGLGYGTLGCDGCNGREGGVSGGLALGGTLSQKVLIGGATTGWTRSEEGVTLSAGTVTAAIRFYPSATGGFFLQGGLGVGTVDLTFDVPGFNFSITETGGGAFLGLGYDIRVAPNMSLSPFWNGFAINWDNGDANVGQIGVALTIH